MNGTNDLFAPSYGPQASKALYRLQESNGDPSAAEVLDDLRSRHSQSTIYN